MALGEMSNATSLVDGITVPGDDVDPANANGSIDHDAEEADLNIFSCPPPEDPDASVPQPERRDSTKKRFSFNASSIPSLSFFRRRSSDKSSGKQELSSVMEC